jgi:uncharacterized iron-regulated membrane protein
MNGFVMHRRFWVLVHRCAGLYLAIFLVIAGASGSLLAFFNELNDRFQLGFMHVEADGRDMIDPFELRERALLRAPGIFIDSVDLTRTPERSYVAWVRHRAEREPDDTPFSVIILDPYSGQELARRVQGNSWPPTTEAIMEFVYALHYRLLLNQIGIWLFGVAALIWTADCFVGFFLTLPARSSGRGQAPVPRRSWPSRWGVAWRVRWRASRFRLHFDLHRASGLWVWPLLLVFALSAVSFNLKSEVYEPLMQTVFGFENVEDGIAPLPAPRDQPIIAWRDAHAAARTLMEQAALQQGFRIIRENMLSYHPDRGIFSYRVLSDKDVNQRFGATTLYMRDGNAERLGLSLPSGQNAARTFTTWIRTIHTAAVGGLLMQVLVSALGLFVVVISLTGVIIFARKRG